MADVVNLGGRTYSLAKKPIRQASAMRQRLNQQIEPLVEMAGRATEVEIRDVEQVGELLNGLRGMLVSYVDILLEMLCEYEPAIQKDREWLLDHAYDEEVIQAAVVMIQQLFPFGNLLSKLNGLAENMTSTNSPSTTVSTVKARS